MVKLFLKKRVEKLLKGFERKKTFRKYDDIKRIVLLFEIEDFEKVVDFVDKLKADGKEVSAYSFDQKNRVFPDVPDYFHLWNNSKMTVLGFPYSGDLKLFKENSHDTLIDLTNHSIPLYNYLFLNSDADFRVGSDNENSTLYDLLIERKPEQDFSFFAEQLLFYMKSLRSK